MTTALVQIEKPVYGGAFLARAEGKAVFVPLALPAEHVRIRIVEDKRGYATAEVEELVEASPQRIVPGCRHFGTCGGCNYQHTSAATQLNFKQAILRETLDRAGVQAPAEIEVLAGEPWSYRNRIRLAFDAEGNPGYRGRRSHALVPIRECPITAPLLVSAALTFVQVVRQTAPNLHPAEIALFCNKDESALLATVFLPHAGKIRFEQVAQSFAERTPALKGIEFLLAGQKGQQARAIAQWGAPSLAYRAAGFDYRVDHGSFFQVNRCLIDALVERVTGESSGKLAWDLYAGVGLFARKLADKFERVIAVESAPSATKALEQNLSGTRAQAVKSETLDFLRRQSEGDRPDLIVVDPPRTGLGAETTAQLARIAASALVYVSCDPATLARDLRALTSSGYAIDSITLADLFPQTFHLETLVRLRRA
ncbi:MAG: 23S rRNA (uracil(1939)-C(5))-methyltransferase RlmD [Terracidiphilus sp.]